ncbi:acyl-CoA synthetase [Streptomyces sp. NPDC048301]|uniref:acyl-CoA synthetase n=1 Tax=Streptomyces sp. NPDC048301 TaxID=3155631 RepID=UPI00342B0D12
MYPGVYARTAPDRPAVIMAVSGERLTYAELETRSVRLARFLHEAGLRKGDTVALLSDNTVHNYEVYWAAMRSGLYLTAVNHHLTAAEAAYIVEDSGARALVVSAGVADLARQLHGELSGPEVRLAYGGKVEGYEDYEAAVEGASAEPLPEQPRGADMLYSSGTTGRPKGIRPSLPEYQLGDEMDQLTLLVQALYGVDEKTVYLSPAPLYHAAPLRYGASVHALGGTVVVMERFDAETALRAVEEHRATFSQWVPTMFVRMLKLPREVRERYDLSSMKAAVHAAAPCPQDVKRAMIDWWGPIICEYYAATEGNGMTFADSAQWLERPGTVGRAVLGSLRICDDEGREVPTGQAGTVYFERDEMPFEYLGDVEKTREAQHPEHPNWSTIGDIGRVDEDGWLYLTDRRSFMIISGGVNIYPQEAENALALHPAVLDVAVIGVPHPEMGEEVKAVVQAAPGIVTGPALEAELLAYVRERIAHYKAPRSVDFVAQLPRTPTGKLMKRKLRL